MSQVKSSSHSPKCIEHSIYPPCIPECRMQKEVKVMPAGYDWSNAAPKGGITLRNADDEVVFQSDEYGNIIKNDDGFRHLSLDSDAQFERELAEEMAKPVRKGDLIGYIGNPVKQEDGMYPGVHQPLGHGLNIEFGGGSESVTDGETFQRNPYLLTNPRACLQHEMAWHWKDQISCEAFEADLDASVGFSDESDEAAIESRKFRIGQSGTVQAYAHRYRQQKAAATVWRRIAFVAIPLGVGANVISLGNVLNWW